MYNKVKYLEEVRYMRKSGFALAMIVSGALALAVMGCGDQGQGNKTPEETRALIIKDEAALYKNSGDTEQIGKVAGWYEVVTYNPDKPENKRIRVDVSDPNDSAKKTNGWMDAGDLLLKKKEGDGILFNGAYMYITPKPGANEKKAKWLNRGVAVKYTGYQLTAVINDKGDTALMCRTSIGSETGWVREALLVTDAHIGVMIEDAPIYQLPDKGAYKLNDVYKKYSLVPVLGEDKEWYKVVLWSKDPVYYIPDGKKVVSFKTEDIGFVQEIGQQYNGARAILDELAAAKEAGDTEFKTLAPKDGAKDAKLKDRLTKLEGFQKTIGDYYNKNTNGPFATDLGGQLMSIDSQVKELKVLLGLEAAPDNTNNGSTDNGENPGMKLD
jgi:hypothetical protein